MKDKTKIYQLDSGLLDLSKVPSTRRIIYLKEEGIVIEKGTPARAVEENIEKYDGRGEVMTPASAARKYPEVFARESGKKKNNSMTKGGMKTILLAITPEMYEYCYRKGNMAVFIRSLIQKDMDYAK